MTRAGYAIYFDRLRQRRKEIEMTVEHLKVERRRLDESAPWMDRVAYRSRVRLLERVAGWYYEELAEVEAAMGRVEAGLYGRCTSCHSPLDAERLEDTPAVELCALCERRRSRAEAG
ncbi:MAG TPA: hypothetical protein VNN77_13480 [candidate division Zixibacteria bacterium]|nr:hypothetical protein [candidate division Zixibacteria bacterium]